MSTKDEGLLDFHAFKKMTAAERSAEYPRVNPTKKFSVTTTKGSLQYDPAKTGEITIGDKVFTIDHCLFNYAINECKIGETAVFQYTRQTLSQAIIWNKAICTIVTNALLAQDGCSTSFYFDLRHAEELTEKAIVQMKKCAAELHGQDGQIILCKEITPVLRMMANGLDVPLMKSVPVLRNEKDITQQFYKALKNNAQEVPCTSPLSAIQPALLASLYAENLLISKLDSTGPGLWKVDQNVYVTCPATLLTGPKTQMSLQTEQALHVSLSRSGVDALTIVEVARLLKRDHMTTDVDHDAHSDANADDSVVSDGETGDAFEHDQGTDFHNDYQPTEDDFNHSSHHNSPHSSCHSDLSLLASAIPDLSDVQAFAQQHTSVAKESPGSAAVNSQTSRVTTGHASQACSSSQTQTTGIKDVTKGPHSTASASGTTGRSVGAKVNASAKASATTTAVPVQAKVATVPVSSSEDSALGKTVRAPAPLRRPVSTDNPLPPQLQQQPLTQASPLQVPPVSQTSSATTSAAGTSSNLTPLMREMQQSRRYSTPSFTTPTSSNITNSTATTPATSSRTAPGTHHTPAPHVSPAPTQPTRKRKRESTSTKRKDWCVSSNSSDSDSDTPALLKQPPKNAGCSDKPFFMSMRASAAASGPLPPVGLDMDELDTPLKDQRSTIRDTKWIKVRVDSTNNAILSPTAATTAPLSATPASQPPQSISPIQITNNNPNPCTTPTPEVPPLQSASTTDNNTATSSKADTPVISSLPVLIQDEVVNESLLLPRRRRTSQQNQPPPQPQPQHQQAQTGASRSPITRTTSTPSLVGVTPTSSVPITPATSTTTTTPTTAKNNKSQTKSSTTRSIDINDSEEHTATQSSSTSSISSIHTQPLLPLFDTSTTLLPTYVRHARTGITMYASTTADYERLGDFLDYALTDTVQQALLELPVPVAVYRGSDAPALSPEVVCIELNQNTLPAASFQELVHTQVALRKEVTIKVEENK